MARIEPISNDNKGNQGSPSYSQQEEKDEEVDYASIHEKVKKGLPYPPPPPRKSDVHDEEQVTPPSTRYGYQKEDALKKQILKQSFKSPPNDLYF